MRDDCGRLFNIGGIVDHHCLNFLFIMTIIFFTMPILVRTPARDRFKKSYIW